MFAYRLTRSVFTERFALGRKVQVGWENWGIFGLPVWMKLGAEWKPFDSFKAIASCRIMSCHCRDALHRADTVFIS